MNKHITIIFAILIAVFIPLSSIEYAHFPMSDGAEHGAAVRALARNLVNPEDPMLHNQPGNSPRYVPSIFLMALCMRLFNLDVLVTLKIFLVLFFLLFLLSAALFSREYFNDSGQAPWTIAAMLFLWGLGYRGANAYMFAAILHTAYYPSVVSFTLALLALYLQLRFMRLGRFAFFAAATITGAIAFANHPLTGGFYFVCSGLLYLEKWRFRGQTFVCYGATIAAAVALTWFWPYNNFFASLFQVTSGTMGRTKDYQYARIYLYSYQPFLRTCLTLTGLPCLLWLLWQRRFLCLTGSFFVFSAIYVGGYYLDFSLSERFIFFILFTLQLAFSRICREWFSLSWPAFRRDRLKETAAWMLIAVLAAGAMIQAAIIAKEYLRPAFSIRSGSLLPRYHDPNTMQQDLVHRVGEGDVVLADVHSSWAIPVYTGARVIALYHTPTHVKDNFERIADVESFFDPSSPLDIRLAVLKKYAATHILVVTAGANRQSGRLMKRQLRGMGFPVVAETAYYCLFGATPVGDGE